MLMENLQDMRKSALITGITGQDGSYLTELLLEKGYAVHGVVRRSSGLSRSRIEHLREDNGLFEKRLFLHYADLHDTTTLRRLFQRVKPVEFYHLAGQSHVGLSFEIPESTASEVAMGTLALLEICRDQSHPMRVYHASSSEIFGKADVLPQDEKTPVNPASPYGCSKAFGMQMARVYRDSYAMYICNGILYNHESPRRGENFVSRKITRTAAAIALGIEKELYLGDLDVQRDWGHARDYVHAMWLMLQQESADDYVVATGRLHRVRDWLESAFGYFNLDYTQYVKKDPRFCRPSEPTRLCGNPAKAENQLGWCRHYAFEDIVREMCESDYQALRGCGQAANGIPQA